MLDARRVTIAATSDMAANTTAPSGRIIVATPHVAPVIHAHRGLVPSISRSRQATLASTASVNSDVSIPLSGHAAHSEEHAHHNAARAPAAPRLGNPNPSNTTV